MERTWTPRGVALLAVLGALVALAVVLASVERGRSAPAPHEAASARAGDAELVAPVAQSSERSSMSAASPREAESDASAQAPLASTGRQPRPRLAVFGRVVDARAAPLAGAELRASDWGDWDRSTEPIATSDARGELAGELASAADWLAFRVTAKGFVGADVSLDARAAGSVQLGTLVLAPGTDVRGTLVDERGQPVVHGFVSLLPGEAFLDDPAAAREYGMRWEGRTPQGLSDEHGRFLIAGVPLGPHFLVAGEFGDVVWSDVFELVLGQVPDVRLVVPVRAPAEVVASIGGIVRAPDGSPLREIAVTGRAGEQESFAVTDEEGRFLLEENWQRPVLVGAHDASLHYGELELADVAPGTRALELRLRAPEWLELRLRDASGAAIAWGHVRGIDSPGGSGSFVPQVDLGREGRARLPRPLHALMLEASAPGFRTAVLGPFDPATLDKVLVLTLAPGQALRGRVTFEGRPVAGASIDLSPTEAPGAWRESKSVAPLDRPFAIRGRVALDGSDGTSARDGAFLVTIHGAGWNAVRVEAAGFPTIVRGPLELTKAGRDGFEIELERAGALEGRVRLAPGASPLGRLVAASDGWGYARTLAVGADGAFRFDDLAPGSYQVRACEPPAGARQPLGLGDEERHDPIEWDCAVRAGETTRFDLDLTQEDACVLVGVFAFGSVHPGAWRATLSDPRSGAARARVGVALDGSFRLALSRPGRYALELSDRRCSFREELELEPGERAWSLAPAAGVLRVHPALPARADEGDGSAERCRVRFVQDGARRFTSEVRGLPLSADWLVSVPVGHGRLEVCEGVDGEWRPLVELDVRGDGESELALPTDSR